MILDNVKEVQDALEAMSQLNAGSIHDIELYQTENNGQDPPANIQQELQALNQAKNSLWQQLASIHKKVADEVNNWAIGL